MYKFNISVIRAYLKEDRPFFHVTPSVNVDSILANGLEWRNPFGICTAIIDDKIATNHLINSQVGGSGAVEYTVIKIHPAKFDLLIGELAFDKSMEITNPLHLYIVRDRLLVDKLDIARTLVYDPADKITDAEVEARVAELIQEIELSVA